MEKHAVEAGSFDKVFLEYLRLRFEIEPLTHYVMAAMQICHETGQDYPEFVRSFFTWFANSFLFDTRGQFPAQSHNADPSDARWRRYEDCHNLLTGWLSNDLDTALDHQEARLVLVEDVEVMRTETRSDGTKSGRRRSETKPDGVIFGELAEERGEKSHTMRRRYKNLSEPQEFMSGVAPIALVRSEAGFMIETREVGRKGEISLKGRGKIQNSQ